MSILFLRNTLPPLCQKSRRSLVVAVSLVFASLALLDVTQLVYTRYMMKSAFSSLYYKTEREKNSIMTSISCMDTSKDVEVIDRDCLLDKLSRSQNPSSLMPLVLLVQKTLESNPGDLQLRVKAVYAISRTIHFHRHAYEYYQRITYRAQKACESSTIGWLLSCQKWFMHDRIPNKIGNLLRIRLALTRGHLYGGEQPPSLLKIH